MHSCTWLSALHQQAEEVILHGLVRVCQWSAWEWLAFHVWDLQLDWLVSWRLKSEGDATSPHMWMSRAWSGSSRWTRWWRKFLPHSRRSFKAGKMELEISSVPSLLGKSELVQPELSIELIRTKRTSRHTSRKRPPSSYVGKFNFALLLPSSSSTQQTSRKNNISCPATWSGSHIPDSRALAWL